MYLHPTNKFKIYNKTYHPQYLQKLETMATFNFNEVGRGWHKCDDIQQWQVFINRIPTLTHNYYDMLRIEMTNICLAFISLFCFKTINNMILSNVIFISNLEKLEKRELGACGESLILLNTKLFINIFLSVPLQKIKRITFSYTIILNLIVQATVRLNSN